MIHHPFFPFATGAAFCYYRCFNIQASCRAYQFIFSATTTQTLCCVEESSHVRVLRSHSSARITNCCLLQKWFHIRISRLSGDVDRQFPVCDVVILHLATSRFPRNSPSLLEHTEAFFYHSPSTLLGHRHFFDQAVASLRS